MNFFIYQMSNLNWNLVFLAMILTFMFSKNKKMNSSEKSKNLKKENSNKKTTLEKK